MQIMSGDIEGRIDCNSSNFGKRLLALNERILKGLFVEPRLALSLASH